MTKNQVNRPVQRTDRRRPGATTRRVAGPAEYGGKQSTVQAKEVTTVLLRQEIGDVLREVRQRQGRTLREVSSSARVSLGYLSEVERGQKEASSELIGSICEALDVPLSAVLHKVADRVGAAEKRAARPVTSVGALRAVDAMVIPDTVPDDLLGEPLVGTPAP